MVLALDKLPLIMGILNLSPDSFYTENKNEPPLLFHAEKYIKADIIDIGCESSRPGAEPLDETNEMVRLSAIMEKVEYIDQILSIDTYKPNVARFALENGFNMLNDIYIF